MSGEKGTTRTLRCAFLSAHNTFDSMDLASTTKRPVPLREPTSSSTSTAMSQACTDALGMRAIVARHAVSPHPYPEPRLLASSQALLGGLPIANPPYAPPKPCVRVPAASAAAATARA